VVSTLHYKLRSGLPVNGEMQLVLHRGEKGSSSFGIGTVIHGHSHQLLCQTDSLVLNTHFDTVFPGLLGENQKFGGTVSDAKVLLFTSCCLFSNSLSIMFTLNKVHHPSSLLASLF
jgi:hypothetical protein